MNSKYYSAKMNSELSEREKGAWVEVELRGFGGLEDWINRSWCQPSFNSEKSLGERIFADSKELRTKRS